MDNKKLLTSNIINFLETLQNELKLSICIDKIYYNCDYCSNILDDKINNILNGYNDDELEENSTIVINKSGEKLDNVHKIIRYLKNLDNLKNKTQINKIIKRFEKVSEYCFLNSVKKVTDFKLIIKEFKEMEK